jgi:hypothetical protein
MNVLMVRAKIKEENVADAQAAVDKVIQALEQAQPAGVHYASSTLSDGVTFVALVELESDGSHPCAGSPRTRRWWRTSSSGTRSRRLSRR